MSDMNLPAHWKTARLGEVADIFKGGTPKRSVEKYFQGNIAWAIPSDITALDSALYIDDTYTHISEEALGKSAARLLPAGTVLLTSRATIGETAITTVPMATNQGFANFSCKEILLNVYLAYYLRFIKKRLIDLASGSTFKEITKGTLLDVEIPLSPLPEQRAIAHVLRSIQEAKAARQREIELERERKAALMDYLFSHGTKGEPRKQTEIGEIPESWNVVQIGQVADLLSGYSQFNSESYVDNGIPIFRIGDLGGQVEMSGVKRVSKDDVPDLNKKRLFRGDILIAKIGKRVGASSAYNFDEPAILSSQVAGVRARRIYQEFLASFIESPFFYDAIKLISMAQHEIISAQAKLN